MIFASQKTYDVVEFFHFPSPPFFVGASEEKKSLENFADIQAIL